MRLKNEGTDQEDFLSIQNDDAVKSAKEAE